MSKSKTRRNSASALKGKSHKGLTAQEIKGVPIKALSLFILEFNVDSLHDHWVRTFEHNCVHRGRNEAIKYMKLLYNQAVNYSLYQEVEYIPFRKSFKDGMSKDIAPFRFLLRGKGLNATRACLLVLRQFEMLYTEPSYNTSTITEPQKCNSTFLRWRFITWLQKRRSKLPLIRVKPPEDFLTTKKGPSRNSALTSFGEDLLAIPDDLLNSTIELSTIFGDNLYEERIKNLKQLLIAKDFTNNGTHSRIQVFSAGGGKTRVIAIVDYWTQRCLRPLHKAIFRNLRKLSADATFGHDSAADWLKTIPKSENIYCFDLTASTDRIPYWMHDAVLRNHLPKDVPVNEIAENVKNLLINRDFTLSWNHSKQVRYECGQPMGAYSSWAFLAYTHHCIARFCGCHQDDYRIIGDDIVLLGDAGPRYKKFMESFGIEISQAKSIISKSTDKHQTGEVAKRLILDGQEITPPTPKLIYKSLSDWRLAPMLFEDMVRRGWCLESTSLLELISNLYSKNWTDKILTILTFPLMSNPSSAKISGILRSYSRWNEYDIKDLAINFVGFRISILERTARRSNNNLPVNVLFLGDAPDGVDPEIYALSPVKSVRQSQQRKTVGMIRRLKGVYDDLFETIADTTDFNELVPKIDSQELYAPDIELQFLETKYQRQKYFANTLLNMKDRADKGSLSEYLIRYGLVKVKPLQRSIK